MKILPIDPIKICYRCGSKLKLVKLKKNTYLYCEKCNEYW